LSSLPSGSSRLYWYCVRLTRSSTVRSCTGCMKSWMPSTPARVGWSRRMTSVALTPRWASGFRLMRIRPLLTVTLVPSTPMNDDRLSTAGSFRITAARACCRAAIAGNEIVCDASEMPWIVPVSCTGKNPFGTTTYSITVSPRVATATARVAGWWPSTQRRLVP